MPNEIQYTARLTVNEGGMTGGMNVTKNLSLAAPGEKFVNDQTLSTSFADISLGDISWSEVSCLGVTNKSTTPGEDIIIQKSSVDMIQLAPGAANFITPKPDGTTYRAKSLAGAPKLGLVASGALA